MGLKGIWINIKDFVFKLPQEIYEYNKNKIDGVIIIIDEFQVIKELGNYLESFLWNFRGYVTEQRSVAYILSGSMGLQDNLISQIAGQNGAFGGRMITININPFSIQTTRDYLKEKAPHLNFTSDGLKDFTNALPVFHIILTFLQDSYLPARNWMKIVLLMYLIVISHLF